MQKTKMAYFGRFWVKELHHPETISDEKYNLYRSARVLATLF